MLVVLRTPRKVSSSRSRSGQDAQVKSMTKSCRIVVCRIRTYPSIMNGGLLLLLLLLSGREEKAKVK